DVPGGRGGADDEAGGAIGAGPVRPEELLERRRGPALCVAHPGALMTIDLGPHELTGAGRRANDVLPPYAPYVYTPRRGPQGSYTCLYEPAEARSRSCARYRAHRGLRRRLEQRELDVERGQRQQGVRRARHGHQPTERPRLQPARLPGPAACEEEARDPR